MLGAPPSAQQERHQQARTEAADMRHVSDAARALVGIGDGAEPLTSWNTIHRPSTTKAGMATICRPSSTFTRACGNIRR